MRIHLIFRRVNYHCRNILATRMLHQLLRDCISFVTHGVPFLAHGVQRSQGFVFLLLHLLDHPVCVA